MKAKFLVLLVTIFCVTSVADARSWRDWWRDRYERRSKPPSSSEWQWEHRISSLVGNNYIDFIEHEGDIFYATNSRNGRTGDLWMQKANSLNSRAGREYNPITQSQLAVYKDGIGRPYSNVRTIGLESYGGKCYMLLHVGQRGPGINQIPAFADSDDCINWTYHGPVINISTGKYFPLYSSSSAYFISDSIHYMAQDQGNMGLGELIVWYSLDGINYEQFSQDISNIPGDKPNFEDMDECDGKFHMLYENGWGVSGEVIRHIISDDLLNWTFQSKNIGIRDRKGMNISCIDDTLYGLRNRTLYKWTGSYR